MGWGDNTDYHSFTREQCEMNNVDYDEIHAEDEMCDEGCGTNLCMEKLFTEDIHIMCWISKDKEEKTVCRTCYDDCGYKKTDTNSDNKDEEELKKTRFRPQTRMGECEGCKGWCEECEGLIICEEEEEEEEYEFYDYGFSKVYKVVIQVAGGGMMNGNAYATVEGEWACEDDFNNGEDGEIHYCEYGPNPKKDYRGNRLIFSDEGTGFNIE